MKDVIPFFRIDLITKKETSNEKIWTDAENYYEQLLKKMRGNLHHLVYLCSPLKPTKQKLVQDHIREAITAASQILGAKYNTKNVAVFVPHVHLFSVYNEITLPQTREKAIKFNNHLIEKYFHTLVVIGNTISGGMAAEIELATKNGIEVVEMENFKKHLKNLPDTKKSQQSYKKMVNFHNKVHGEKFLIKSEIIL